MALILPLAACHREQDAPEIGPAESATPPAESREPPPTVLDPLPDEPFDRALRGGETQTFGLPLADSQFLDIRVDQHGVDVVVRLFSPLRQLLIEVDNPSGADGTHGTERLVWVAEHTGPYHLEIRAWGDAHATGRYSLEVESLRPASEEDRFRVVAEKAKADADMLFGQQTQESWLKAIDRAREALAGFVTLDDRARQADTHFRLGETWRALGDRSKARVSYEAALAVYEATHNERQHALTLHELCDLEYRARTRVSLALQRCEQALPLWEKTGDRRGLALTSNSLGLFYRLLREDHRALLSYDQALELWRKLGNSGEEARTLTNRGWLYSALGDYQQAVADFEQALEIRRDLNQSQGIADTLNSLGFVHSKWKAMAAARRCFQEALELRPDENDLTTGNSLFGLGLTHRDSESERAGDAIRRALEIFRAVDARQGEAVALLVLSRVDENRHAGDHLAAALAIFESLQDFSGIAETRLAMATAARRLGKLEEAKTEIEQALEIVEDLRASVATGTDMRASFFATQQVYYELYVDLLMELDSTRPAGGYAAEALAASEKARSRSLVEALTDRHSRPRQDVDPRLLEEELSLERQIYVNQERLQRLLESPQPEPDPALRLDREQRDLQRRYEKLQGQIRLSSADLTRPRLSSAADIQQLLDSESLLLEYELGESRSFVWALTPEAITGFVLPQGRSRIEKLAKSVHRSIAGNKRATRVKVQTELARLSHILLAPLASHLGQARRLLIVADGALQYVPFEALPLPGPPDPKPVTTAFEVVYLPSASTLAVLRDRLASREPAPRLLAVVADPVFGLEDPRLSGRTNGPEPSGSTPAPGGERSAERISPYPRLIYSALEAETLLTLVPTASQFLDFDASRDALSRGELGRHRILHFATHGDLNAEYAGLSRLVLSLVGAAGQKRDDGFWYAYEIRGEEIPAELVVLSACQTALGEQILGEGLVGLPQSFMNAGAARVLVSLWRVDDQATAALMGRFYEGLLRHQLSPPAALRAAKSFIRSQDKWRAPYFWAGFVLQGEWRDIQRSI